MNKLIKLIQKEIESLNVKMMHADIGHDRIRINAKRESLKYVLAQYKSENKLHSRALIFECPSCHRLYDETNLRNTECLHEIDEVNNDVIIYCQCKEKSNNFMIYFSSDEEILKEAVIQK